VVPGRAGAALTKPGRASTARWGGPGERGGKEYARNRRCYVLDFDTGSNLVTGVLYFDLPTRDHAVMAELYDSVFSGGVTISLAR
jgi:hypothetical protein